MHIPVKIEIECMVHVILIVKKNKDYINTIEKWCVVKEIFNNAVRVDDTLNKIPLFAIELFTFGGVVIPNPEFDLNKVLKMK